MRGGRQAILEAAIRVFARKGYSAASTREICRQAGITKPVLYYHFAGKEQLFRELLADSFGHFLEVLLRSSQCRGNLRERLVRMIYNDFCDTKANPERVRFILRMVFAPEEQHPHFNYVEEMDRQREVIARVLQDGIDSGEAHGDAWELAGALMGIELVAILENLFAGRRTLTRRNAERCVDRLLSGCVANRTLYSPVNKTEVL